MPYSIRRTKGGKYSVKNPHGTKARGTTKAKAEKQVHLLRAIEHGWQPRTHGQKVARLKRMAKGK